MRTEDMQILKRFAERVRGRFPDAEVWAFGSRARGDAGSDSDLDICVVLPELDRRKDEEILDVAWEVGFEADVVISTVTFSEADFTRGPCAASPLVEEIRENGVAA